MTHVNAVDESAEVAVPPPAHLRGHAPRRLSLGEADGTGVGVGVKEEEDEPEHPEVQGDTDRRSRDPDLEATELDDYIASAGGISVTDLRKRTNSARSSDDLRRRESVEPSAEHAPYPGFFRPEFARLPTTARQQQKDSWLRRFWRHHVRVAVPHDKCRDHLALERTFLGFLRTSTMIANVGVVVVQLFQLQSDPSDRPGFTLRNSGRGVGSMMIVVSMYVVVVGGWRFYRQQNAMTRGKIWAGGWELQSVGFLHLAVVLVLFVIIVAVPYS